MTQSQIEGQQTKKNLIEFVSSPAYSKMIQDDLVAAGFPEAAADSFAVCYQSELLKLTQNSPPESFDVPEEEIMEIGNRLGRKAANNCINKLSG